MINYRKNTHTKNTHLHVKYTEWTYTYSC